MNCSFCGKDKKPLFNTQSAFTGVDKPREPRYTCLSCIDMEMDYLASFIDDLVVLSNHQQRVDDFILKNK